MIQVTHRIFQAAAKPFGRWLSLPRCGGLAIVALACSTGVPACYGSPPQEQADRPAAEASKANPLHLSDLLRKQSPRAADSARVAVAEPAALPAVQLKGYVFRDASHAIAILEVQGGGRKMLALTSGDQTTEFVLGGCVFQLRGFDRSGFELERLGDGAKLRVR